ncbi:MULTISPECIES: radical SAM/SPASM domain-containing protein [unclassified Nocardiopsis]|uniref:radical SAM/SPASM domain-containing protein n=1 Tax=unclassified Nocardiopsis TaxID=2649073 RepID=UPI001356CA5E|nr:MULTISPECIES: radical SAM/SPASM domain-containing protein [unclassified Nocardiopsis]
MATSATPRPTDYHQPPPNSVQLEPVEGCNLRCSFCGIRGIRESTGDRDNLSGPYRCMSLDTAATIARQIAVAGWNPRVELAMHGEPTKHPALPDLIRIIRSHLPRQPIMVTTNGLPLLEGWPDSVGALFAAGADTVAVDDYRPHKARAAVLGTRLPGVDVYRYPEDGSVASAHRRPRRGERRLILIADISQADEGNHSNLSNHAGAAGPPDERYANQRCANPFREMAIRWDGSVAICCNDWRGAFKLGNVHATPVDELWQHPAMGAARRRLYAGRRDFAPCKGCTHRTYRNGLLPDRMGQDELEPPRAGDDALLASAVAGPTFTLPIRRRWEMPDEG